MAHIKTDYAHPDILSGGFHKNHLRNLMAGEMNIPAHWRQALSGYFLRAWKPSFASAVLSHAVDGRITHNDVVYNITYRQGVGPATIAALSDADESIRVSFSFREAKPEWGLPPVVLISIWRNFTASTLGAYDNE